MTDQARPLRVGVNLLWLVPGVVGGSEDYVTRLLRALGPKRADGVEVVLFTLRQFPAAHPDLAVRFPTVVAPIDGANKPLRVAVESTWLAREVRRHDIDVVHHAGGRVPLVAPAPSVVTIHDLQPLDMPQNFSAVKRRFLARALPRTARRAAVITAPSGFVRDRVVDLLGVPRERTAVVPAPLRDREGPTVGHDSPLVIELHEAAAPYFVYPAITYPHKNHVTLLHAFSRLRQQHPEARLVLTGGEGPDEAVVRSTIAALDLDSSVLRTGRVSRADLDSLIAGAAALVFPSRYEGFGLPVLEAMAAGCPVVAADATALPEVVDGVGVLVDPDDIDGWAGAMATATRQWRDRTGCERSARADAERARAADFSPESSVAALVDAYRQAGASARRRATP